MDGENSICSLIDQPLVSFLEGCWGWLRGTWQVLACLKFGVECFAIQVNSVEVCLVAKKHGQWYHGYFQGFCLFPRNICCAVSDDTNGHFSPPDDSTYYT